MVKKGQAKNKSIVQQPEIARPDPNTIQVGVGTKIITQKLSGENGYVKDISAMPENIRPQDIELAPFKGTPMTDSDFNILNYLVYCNPQVAAGHLSKTKEYKQHLKKRNLRLTVANGKEIIICANLHASTFENILSFNKACAVMALSILKHQFGFVYDWDNWQGKDIEKKEVVIDPEIINRLASSMGLSPDSPYYWLVVPGFEFLYDAFPVEVIALVLARLNYRKEINIPDDMSDSDIVNSLTMKMNRRHNLTTTKISDVIEKLGKENIYDEYKAITENIGKSGRTVRNEEMVEALKILTQEFAKIK